MALLGGNARLQAGAGQRGALAGPALGVSEVVAASPVLCIAVAARVAACGRGLV
jgi:hypothetical protein